MSPQQTRADSCRESDMMSSRAPPSPPTSPEFSDELDDQCSNDGILPNSRHHTATVMDCAGLGEDTGL
jgi:hypothetical protein